MVSPLTRAARPLRATTDCMAAQLGCLAGCAFVIATSVEVLLNPCEGERTQPLIAPQLTERVGSRRSTPAWLPSAVNPSLKPL